MLEEACRGVRGRVGEDFRVREARTIIERYVRVVLPDATDAVAAFAMESMAHATDLSQLLNVGMHQFAETLAFLTHCGAWRLQQ